MHGVEEIIATMLAIDGTFKIAVYPRSVELVRMIPQPGNAFVVRDPKRMNQYYSQTAVVFLEPGIGYRNTWAAYSNPVFDPTSFGVIELSNFTNSQNGTGVLFVLEGNAFSVTSGEITSSQITSAAATTQSVTSGQMTSGTLTYGMITSGNGNNPLVSTFTPKQNNLKSHFFRFERNLNQFKK